MIKIKADEKQYELFTFDLENDGCLKWVAQDGPNEYMVQNSGISKSAVMIIGDRFMKGAFMPATELAKTTGKWNSTIHDINHMATTYPMGLMMKSNIEYVIGYQKNTRWDATNKRMMTDIVIKEHAPKYVAWKNYIDICNESGRIPNVSVSFFAKRKQVKASELPKGTNYAAHGYADDDLVDCIHDIHPVALSTVLIGACNDKDGCGIKGCSVDQSSLDQGDSGADSSDSDLIGCTEIPAKELKGLKAVKADEARIKYFQKRIKELKGGNKND